MSRRDDARDPLVPKRYSRHRPTLDDVLEYLARTRFDPDRALAVKSVLRVRAEASWSSVRAIIAICVSGIFAFGGYAVAVFALDPDVDRHDTASLIGIVNLLGLAFVLYLLSLGYIAVRETSDRRGATMWLAAYEEGEALESQSLSNRERRRRARGVLARRVRQF